MHFEILTEKQKELLPYLAQFKRSFYLVGGTAIALHIGHRYSVDFDLFTFNTVLEKNVLKQKIVKIPFKKFPIFEDIDQIHTEINGIKTTLFAYPHQITHNEKIENYLTMPSLLELAAMKAFALSRRAKWKDYVDLYFIIRDFFPLKEIANKAEDIFSKELFSEKLFYQQLAFHEDINYSEEVEYLAGFEVDDETVKIFLIDKSIEILKN
jgi:hypothetical protein